MIADDAGTVSETGQPDIFSAVNDWAYREHRNLIDAFSHHLGFWPNVACPARFTEKILWRKLFDHNPLFGPLCDKLLARAWMAEQCPDLKVARTLWTGDRAADITDSVFNGGVVLKTNHGSGFNIALPRAPADRRAIERKLEAWLTIDFHRVHHEWGYRLVERKIFAEELLSGSPGDALLDFNFYCCDGEVVFYVITVGEKTDDEAIGFFLPDGGRDCEGERTPTYDKKFLPDDYRLPGLTPRALEMAAALSRGLDFVRVDIMLANGQLYAGEMTLYPQAGYGVYTKFDIVRALARAWDIRKSWFLTTPQTGASQDYASALRNRPIRPGTALPGVAW